MSLVRRAGQFPFSTHTPGPGRTRGGSAISALWLLAAMLLLDAPSVRADQSDEEALARRFAPIVRLVAHGDSCNSRESFVPIDVDALFGEPTVALRGPWGSDLIKIAPVAADLTAARYGYYLDFPGNPLRPRCSYERWAQHLDRGRSPTVYAHVVADRRRRALALQYWMFYVFNDWNNTHEGDWEMIQLDFDVATPRDALARAPTVVGYSQHEAAERAAWGDPKLEIVGGTHPVVHPAAGSHANFFGEALFLGTSGSAGVGCDDTRGPTTDLDPIVVTIPSDSNDARAAYPWIAFAGQWGEAQPGFYGSPTGPNLKPQWREPLEWAALWRDRSIAVPAGGVLGTGATDFFCRAVAAGSVGVRRGFEHPLPMFLIVAAALALLWLGASKTTWRPSAPLRLARRRAWGQILSGSERMYREHLALFAGIGLLTLPVSVLISLMQTSLLRAPSVAGIETDGERGGLLAVLVVAVATLGTVLELGFVVAAVVRAMLEIDARRTVSPIRAYRLAFDSAGPLVGALVIATVVISALATSVFLIPVAIWLLLRWTLVVPVVEMERRPAVESLRGSAELVRHGRLKVASLAVATTALAVAAGPFVGAMLILFTSIPLSWINAASGIAYAIAMPIVAIATTLVYFDVRVRAASEGDRSAEWLPAELELAPAPRPGGE